MGCFFHFGPAGILCSAQVDLSSENKGPTHQIWWNLVRRGPADASGNGERF